MMMDITVTVELNGADKKTIDKINCRCALGPYFEQTGKSVAGEEGRPRI